MLERISIPEAQNNGCNINFSPYVENFAWIHSTGLPIIDSPNSPDIGMELLNRAKESSIIVAIDGMTVSDYLRPDSMFVPRSHHLFPILNKITDTNSLVVAADFISKEEYLKMEARLLAISGGILFGAHGVGKAAMKGIKKISHMEQEESYEYNGMSRRTFLKRALYLAGFGTAIYGCSYLINNAVEESTDDDDQCIEDGEDATPVKGPGISDVVARNVVVHSKLYEVAQSTNREGKMVMGSGHYNDNTLITTRNRIQEPNQLLAEVVTDELAFVNLLRLPFDIKVAHLSRLIFNATTSHGFEISSSGDDVILHPAGYYYNGAVSFSALNDLVNQSPGNVYQHIEKFSANIINGATNLEID